MDIVRKGIFYRIRVDKSFSKKCFLSYQSALKYYYSHQDRDGFPIKEEKWT